MATVRRSLILAGGGMKVGYQAGVLQVLLDEAGLAFDHADGTSGGCLNLAQLQSGLSGTAIADNWRRTGPFELTSLQPWYRYLTPWRIPAMLTFDRLLRQLPTWGVDFERVRRNEPAGTYNVYNFSDKVFETHDGTELTPELFTACFSLPIWFPPVRIEDTTYIDGVYWKDANLTEAVRRGADEIWVIWTVSETRDVRPGPYNGYFSIIEAIADGRFYEELREIEAINEAVRAGTDTEHREIRVHVIRHPTPVPLDYLLFYSAGDMSRIVDMGVRDARAYLSAEGIPFEPSGPLAPPIGKRFTERMRGWWTRGEPDPERGAAEGRATGSVLDVHLTITIDDLDVFLDDPARVATARGFVICPALGGRLRVEDGTFNVLNEVGPNEREMRYTLPFRGADGEAYRFVGVKHVAQQPGLDAWDDTTTLFTTIRRGETDDGPLVGSGILTLGLADLARQVTTLRIVRPRDPATLALAYLGFVRHFAGSLLAIYGPGGRR
jgi:predicted patatin/cPLA2 family phospholipase